MDYGLIVARINTCKQLMFKSCFAQNDCRQRDLPSNFETQKLLNVDCHVWSLKGVDEMPQYTSSSCRKYVFHSFNVISFMFTKFFTKGINTFKYLLETGSSHVCRTESRVKSKL